MSQVTIETEHQYCFETLSNPLRLDIIGLLQKGSMNVTQLAAATKAERSRVSHALQVLRRCHLVTTEKRGREVVYALNRETPVFKEARGSIFALVAQHCRANCAVCARSGKAPFR
jgi:DNA-binding transcriptional ArsR family regulator